MREAHYISIPEVVTYMNSGKPFSITYITYDHQKGAGGSIKEVQLATKHHQKSGDEPAGKMPEAAVMYALKNPNHFSNSTTNIRVLGSGQAKIRKVHIQLIRRFNGAIVK